MNPKEAEKLVKEYNEIEVQQRERLTQLFDYVNARKSYRIVRFTRDTWSNCWGLPERLSHPRFVDIMAQQILEFNPGKGV